MKKDKDDVGDEVSEGEWKVKWVYGGVCVELDFKKWGYLRGWMQCLV